MAIDLERLKGRLAEAAPRIEGNPDPAPTERVLRERARHLANRHLDTTERHLVARVMVLRSTQLLLGIPMEFIDEVREVRITRLPHGNPVLPGLFQLKGRIHSVVDLHASARTAPLAHDARVFVALLASGSLAAGLRIDEVIGARSVFADEIDPGLATAQDHWISHVTRELVHVVDVARLFSSTELCLEVH